VLAGTLKLIEAVLESESLAIALARASREYFFDISRKDYVGKKDNNEKRIFNYPINQLEKLFPL
jgi:hypothetical protein